MGVVAHLATMAGRLPGEGGLAYDWPTPQEDGVGSWKFPKTKTVPAAAGLNTIAHYVQVHMAPIMLWVEDKPIPTLCREAERKRGTTSRLY